MPETKRFLISEVAIKFYSDRADDYDDDERVVEIDSAVTEIAATIENLFASKSLKVPAGITFEVCID